MTPGQMFSDANGTEVYVEAISGQPAAMWNGVTGLTEFGIGAGARSC